MSDFHADWASLSDCFGDPATSYEDRRLMSYAFVKAHHAAIQQNAEYAYHLREILAVINGDGGHYLAKHGVKDSSERAINKIAELIIECDKNAENVKEWEVFGRQIEKRLRYNNLGLTGGYPEMIDVLLGMAKRLRALERAIKEWGGDTIPNIVVFLMGRADEILREGEPHDQD